MGCASSKKVCKRCYGGNTPVRRSYSALSDVHHHHHHLHQETEDHIHHIFSLNSSMTLGSLIELEPFIQNDDILKNGDNFNAVVAEESKGEDEDEDENKEDKEKEIDQAKQEFAMGMIEAKTWSNMINEKIPKIMPKTPIQTPPGEPEMINAWEMMEGLEDIDSSRSSTHHFRSFSFPAPRNNLNMLCSNDDQPTPRVVVNGDIGVKPSWLDSIDTDSNSNSNSNDTSSVVSELDPEVIATLRKAIEDLPLSGNLESSLDHEKKNIIIPSRGKDKVIVYFTSLRGVRKTFEDCCQVRVILNGLGVKVDERDVSMHSGFKEELKELLGEGFGGGSLPKVFIGKTYIGGADEIQRLNEEGKLDKMVESCELVVDNVCEACGDVRFMPCETCSGSCKVYYERDEDEDEVEEVIDDGDNEFEFGFRRCSECNENGLVRCPICCD